MKLSLVFELLLIFVLLAFAASKSVKRRQKNDNKKGISKEDDVKIEENGINKFCKCSEAFCNCCRDFQIPIVKLEGPGCASLMHLNDDKMSVSLSFGKKVITNRTLSGKRPSPVCMPLPGGISKFCGRVYNIARAGEEFRACLGLELQSKNVVEAAVRVSCFKFGPRGVSSEPADPLPLVPKGEAENDDDDDDDDEDDDDDDDDDFGLGDDDDDDELEAVNDVGGVDYSGFSLLGEDLLGDLFGGTGGKKPNKNKNNKKKQAPIQPTSTTTTSTTKRPRPTRRPTRRPSSRITTLRTPSSTTVKIRPAGTRRPNRRPTRRPNRRTTTTLAPTIEIIPNTPLTNPAAVRLPSAVTPPTLGVQSTERINQISVTESEPSEPLVLVTQKIVSTVATTTPKPAVTNFEDPGLQMSLASLAGQLSVMPGTPILDKEPSVMTTVEDSKYQKIETITPKTMSTASFYSTAADKDSSERSEEIIQIVQSLDDSQSSENMDTVTDRSRGYNFNHRFPVHYEGLQNKHKKHGNGFRDYDYLGLTEIGETIGENIGVFGKGKGRRNRNKNGRVGNHRNKNDRDYEDFGLTELSELSGLAELANISGGNGHRKKHNNNNNRRRQNKMMRGEWSSGSHV